MPMLIIWDYFGVMAQDAFWYTVKRYTEDNGMSQSIMLVHDQVNRGTISWEEYCSAIASDIGVPYDEVINRYEKHNIKEQNVLTIKALSHHRHVLLSNASSEYLLPVMETLGLARLFDKIFVSSDIGAVKPEAKAFQYVLRAMNEEAKNSIMIDDAEENIQAAESLGIHGIHYTQGVHVHDRISSIVALNGR